MLPDGRVVTGGEDSRVLVWNPAAPGDVPVELGRHDSAVRAVAVLPDGRVVTGGDDRRVLLWNPRTRTQCAESRLSSWEVSAIATSSRTAVIAIVQYGELSVWST